MTHYVVDTKKTIIVTREAVGFKVTKLDDGSSIKLSPNELSGTSFKYHSDFIRKFQKCFHGEKITSVILSSDANDYISELINFNREDS